MHTVNCVIILEVSPPAPSNGASNGKERGIERIGFGYLIMSSVKGTFGAQTVSITSLRHQPIGKINGKFCLLELFGISSSVMV